MQYRSKRRFTTRRLLALLLVLSVIGLLLPTRITGQLMNLVQVLVPLQDAATRAADAAGETLAEDGRTIPPQQYDRLAREAEALRHKIASQSARITELEEANRQLTDIRGRGLGQRGALIPARVVADDLLGWRDSRLLDAGTLRGVRRGAPVTTRWYSLNVGRDRGVAEGMAVLTGEVLLGWVEHAGTHTARVRLLTEPASRLPVALGRFEGQEFRPVPADGVIEFWMESTGPAGMRIVDVDHRYVEGDDGIRPGDQVVTLPDDPRLPLSLMIGTVAKVTPDPENPLLYILTVNSAAPARLTHVYVLNLELE